MNEVEIELLETNYLLLEVIEEHKESTKTISDKLEMISKILTKCSNKYKEKKT